MFVDTPIPHGLIYNWSIPGASPASVDYLSNLQPDKSSIEPISSKTDLIIIEIQPFESPVTCLALLHLLFSQ